MSEPLEPLDPELARLLGAERDTDVVPEEADAIFARLGATMGWPPPGGPAGGGSDGGDGGAAPGLGGASLLTNGIARGIAIGILGFAAGAATHAAIVAPSAPSVPVALQVPVAIATAPSATPREEVAALPSMSAAAIASAAPPRLAPRTSAGPIGLASEVALAQERDLLQGARMAFVRGQTSAARALLDEHEARFPRGQLVEEREALRIQALAREGRLDEARARAERFRRTFPQSLSLAGIDAALAGPR